MPRPNRPLATGLAKRSGIAAAGAAILTVGWVFAATGRADSDPAPPPRLIAAADRAAAPIDRCDSCHKADPALTHPIGLVPSMPVPAYMPLERGQVTCTTCHAIDSEADHDAAKRLHDPWLRGITSAAGFCGSCHASDASLGRAPHTLLPARAHLGWSEATARPVIDPQGVEADATCLSCHDGAVAAAAGRELQSGRPLERLGEGHPIGVAYGRFPAGSGFMELHPRHLVDRRVRLVEGRVGCGSCHSLYSPHASLLVMPNDASSLCLACHDL